MFFCCIFWRKRCTNISQARYRMAGAACLLSYFITTSEPRQRGNYIGYLVEPFPTERIAFYWLFFFIFSGKRDGRLIIIQRLLRLHMEYIFCHVSTSSTHRRHLSSSMMMLFVHCQLHSVFLRVCFSTHTFREMEKNKREKCALFPENVLESTAK